MSFKSCDDGLTLIELLLAFGICALVVSIVAVTFAGTLSVIERARADQQQVHQARRCLTMMAEELTTARQEFGFPWMGRNEERDGQPADTLALVSAGHARHRRIPHTDAMRVVYSREGDTLVRWALPNLYGTTDAGVERTEVASNVVGFNLRYFDPAMLQWTDVWERQTGPPGAILIELTLTNSRREPRTFTQWLSLPAAHS